MIINIYDKEKKVFGGGKIKALIISFLFAITVVGYGQDENSDNKLTVDVGADFVSSYVWRGMYQAGVSLQPALNFSMYGVTIGAWGSSGFPASAKELDFYLSYELKGFSVSIADYWWKGEGASYFKDAGSHHLEVGLAYTFSEKFPLSLEINAMLSGDEDKDNSDRKYYSTYISASFPFSVRNIDCEAGIGITPRKGMYSNKFDVVAITAKASKKLHLSAEYALAVFAELIFSPAQDNAFLVFGIRF